MWFISSSIKHKDNHNYNQSYNTTTKAKKTPKNQQQQQQTSQRCRGEFEDTKAVIKTRNHNV